MKEGEVKDRVTFRAFGCSWCDSNLHIKVHQTWVFKTTRRGEEELQALLAVGTGTGSGGGVGPENIMYSSTSRSPPISRSGIALTFPTIVGHREKESQRKSVMIIIK